MNKQFKRVAKIALLTTASIHVANVVTAHLATSKGLLDKNPGHYYHWKDNDIYYQKEGYGTPLLLLHNLYPDSSGFEWNNVINNLAYNHTVYTIDLVGCGRSSKPEITYTNFYIAQLISSFIKDVIQKPTCVVASMNTAPIAIVAANLNRSQFFKLILINPVSLKQMTQAPTTRKRIRQLIFTLPVYGRFLYQFDLQHPREKLSFLTRFAYFSAEQQRWPDAYCEGAHLGQGKGRYLLASLENNYLNLNMKSSLQDLSTPTHIIMSSGYKDAYPTALSYTKLKPSIKISVVCQSNYLPQIDEPRRTCDTIESCIHARESYK